MNLHHPLVEVAYLIDNPGFAWLNSAGYRAFWICCSIILGAFAAGGFYGVMEIGREIIAAFPKNQIEVIFNGETPGPTPTPRW